jgi:hypothetical protein
VRMSAHRLFSRVLNMRGESDARRVACPVWSSEDLGGGGCWCGNNIRLKPSMHNIFIKYTKCFAHAHAPNK